MGGRRTKNRLVVLPILLFRHLSLRLTPEAAPGLLGVTQPRRRRCDETKPRRARPTRLAPSCTLAQPAASLPPLVGSYPTVSALTASDDGSPGVLSVAVVVVRPLPACRPHLLFREATFPCHKDTSGSREVPLTAGKPDRQRRISNLSNLFNC